MRPLLKLIVFILFFIIFYNFLKIDSRAFVTNKNYNVREINEDNFDTQTTTIEQDTEDRNNSLIEHFFENVSKIIQCYDQPLKSHVEQRGDFYILYNYIPAERSFRCFETITYSTQGDVNFLDNLIPLVEKWRGPVSVSVYAPGNDFMTAVKSIIYLRECESSLIKELVSFHLFFDAKHYPKNVRGGLLKNMKLMTVFDCSKKPPYSLPRSQQYKTLHNLSYPINVGRNSAKLAAQTHFILGSDMELYPSPNFIPKFLKMIHDNSEILNQKDKQVFVLPHFEVSEDSQVPSSKTELTNLIRDKKANFFHEYVCKECHRIPKYSKWLQIPESEELHIFAATKRRGFQHKWEPFYVGTKDDPFFDERLTWEGQKNKMTQNYILCLLDYTYNVLDNAFLVHRPGIKRKKVQMQRYMEEVDKTVILVRKHIKPEIDVIFGYRDGCKL